MKHIKEYNTNDITNDLDSLGFFYNYTIYAALTVFSIDKINNWTIEEVYHAMVIKIRTNKKYAPLHSKWVKEVFKELAFKKAEKGEFTQDGLGDIKAMFGGRINKLLDDTLLKDKRFFNDMDKYDHIDDFMEDMASEVDEILYNNEEVEGDHGEEMKHTEYEFTVEKSSN